MHGQQNIKEQSICYRWCAV